MLNETNVTEMLLELRLIEDEIQSTRHFLRYGCNEQETPIFEEMLRIALLERKQVNIILEDYYNDFVDSQEITDLLVSSMGRNGKYN